MAFRVHLLAFALLLAMLSGCGRGAGGGSTPRLTVTVGGTGQVSSSPPGIDCPGQCAKEFPPGSGVTLAATPGTNQQFNGWTGACSGASTTCTLSLTADAQVGAQFNDASGSALSVAVNGPGSVKSSPAGIDCPGTCSAVFSPGAAVTLTATAAGKSTFTGWNGSCSGSASCALTMNGPQSVSATFAPMPELGIAGAPLTVVVPQNCPASLSIKNTDTAGSNLQYSVNDDGALGGYLLVQNGIGSVPSGQTATVIVSVRPEWVAGVCNQFGCPTLVVNVYTPGASNYTKFPVTVYVVRAEDEAQKLAGTWSGTWSGFAVPPGSSMTPQTAVSGTWSLQLNGVDLNAGTASGFLTWNGTDAYFTYSSGVWTPHPFIPDRTIAIQSSLSSTTLRSSGGCPLRFELDVEGYAHAPNPSDDFYGPRFSPDLHPDGTLVSAGVAWSAHPYDPSNYATGVSSGGLIGHKN